MKYSFDIVNDRRNTNSLKWDIRENELPLWVADMDFQAAPEIQAELEKRCHHGVYGYTIVPKEWYEAYQEWWENEHHFKMERDWLIFCDGVIPAISSVIRHLTAVGDNIVAQTPVYNNIFTSILNNGRNLVENKLRYDGEHYSIDFEDLEEKLSDDKTTMMILCNPQNPAGIIWSKEELKRIGEMCFKHNVYVLADEIHCDITEPSYEYTPFASLNEMCRENCVMCISPTKTFNIAGLQTAAVAIPNASIRQKVNRGLNADEIAEPSFFAVTGAIAAFTKGGEWLKEAKQYIFQNKEVVEDYIEKELPQLKLVSSHATYLLWIDCSKVTNNSARLAENIRLKTGLVLSEGSIFKGNGEDFLRMNIACPRAMLMDGLQRLKKGIAD